MTIEEQSYAEQYRKNPKRFSKEELRIAKTLPIPKEDYKKIKVLLSEAGATNEEVDKIVIPLIDKGLRLNNIWGLVNTALYVINHYRYFQNK